MILSRALSRLRGRQPRHTAPPVFRGFFDGLREGRLTGWAVRACDGSGGLRVGLFAGPNLLDTALARENRGDVHKAGAGESECGVSFPLSPALHAAADADESQIHLRVLDAPEQVIGRLAPGTLRPMKDICAHPHLSRCLDLLAGDLPALDALVAPDHPRPPLHRHTRLFDPGDDQTGLSAYLEFTRLRMRKETEFDPATIPEDRDHFLHWYISVYSPRRGGLRVPLSRREVDYLTGPVHMGGQRHNLPRAMWWRLLDSPDTGPIRMSSARWRRRAAYWWAAEETPRLFMEDCLVPADMAALLRHIPKAYHGAAYPLSVFMEEFLDATPQFSMLNRTRAADRQLLTLILAAQSARRPDLLRYLPRNTLTTLFEGEHAPFSRFLAATGRPPLTRARFVAALCHKGYDPETDTFLSCLPKGRLEAARRPAVVGEKVDVQVIGPLGKASGLGQAARLSARALSQTGLRINAVDFALDNPAPEGFSTPAAHADFRPARINLLHLNAESVPLAFAYGADVFSDSYNIGYVFWELDSPARCHRLGLKLLDEIWVASDYGLRCYRPHAGIPVRNMGMSFEQPPRIDTGEARTALRRRFAIGRESFVFLLSFDSYSFVQRKNPIGAIRAFRMAFAADEDVRLIVKTQNRDDICDRTQERIWKQLAALAGCDPRILIVNETLPYETLLHIKAGCDCYVSLHRSEGWGFGMIEAMSLGIPVVCTGYSGNMDYCSPQTAWLVDSTETLLTPDDYIFVETGQKWAEPDIAHAARQMRALWADPLGRANRARTARDRVRRNFGTEALARRYGARLREILGNPSLPNKGYCP
ncbi:glycosyltransferase involved in cell wall biosynthesis [Rhodovulum imhoffii]|uniref:Glycosyltransferase involved in cell wall biosynthesis n=1 Tax=Rhodovulum imhoffii TaxID=365340 RepID=A0A2T5BV27_9RHOB|nr:glycosyltransferase family 4 protein [Rhodovulum imhoffii]MBK5934643.1 hypothetical protein [Rhodovulum imhoffii]PTN03383.1 glycosyltransferase involved in cell wall biosynthesis [Rhodovulum imhoffii]